MPIEIDSSLNYRHVCVAKDKIFTEILNDKTDKKIAVMTDFIASWLMSCSKPYLPWDLIAYRNEYDHLVIDQREDSEIGFLF